MKRRQVQGCISSKTCEAADDIPRRFVLGMSGKVSNKTLETRKRVQHPPNFGAYPSLPR